MAFAYIFSAIVFSFCDFNTKDGDMFSTMSFYTDKNSLLPEWYYHREAELYFIKRSKSAVRRSNVNNSARRINYESLLYDIEHQNCQKSASLKTLTLDEMHLKEMLKEKEVRRCVADVKLSHPLLRKLSTRDFEGYYSMIEQISKDANNSRCHQFYKIRNGEILEFVPPPRMDWLFYSALYISYH